MDRKKEQPTFIQKRRELRRQIESTLTKRRSQSPASISITETQIRDFWKNLLDELRCIIDALHEIDSVGSVNTFGEEIVRISLSDNRLQGVTTSTDLILDGQRIRSSVFDGGIYYLNFVELYGDSIFVQDVQRVDDPMDARKAAEHVIDRMLNIIEWMRP